MAEKYGCHSCRKNVAATKNNRYRSHATGEGESCEMSSVEIPEHILANGPVDVTVDPSVPVEGVDYAVCACGRKVKLTRLGYFEPHDETLRGGNKCPKIGTRYRPTAAEPPVSAEVPIETAAESPSPAGPPPPASPTTFLQPEPISEGSSPESPTTSESSARYGSSTNGPSGSVFSQPASPFLQPVEYLGPVKPEPMGDLAKELATKIKETFYGYSNRKTKDNRGAQTTLGPSEIGTPCDRRLAMALMNIPAVNPGGDGWASFVGTCGHVGMGEVYTFADAGTGRYAVELPVFLGMPSVPRGTTDLLDRRDGTVVDWKFMGAYSLKKFKAEGPTPTYRTQAHVYGLGAERGGEKVRNVAVVGLPRAGSSLDEMHVWTEKFDRKFAQAALDRVEKIAREVRLAQGPNAPMEIAQEFPTDDDCRYCPFHLKGDKEMNRGCPGK